MKKNLEGRSKFNRFRARRFQEEGVLLSMAGFLGWKAISNLDEQTRKFIRGDIRKEGVTAIQLSLINEISQHYENEKPPIPDFPDEKPRMGE